MTEADFLRATRESYNAVAVTYAGLVRDELAARPLDRALLSAFAELVTGVPSAAAGVVADIGCGPGRISAFLTGLGATTIGIDLSPAMIALATQTYPELSFAEGSMLALELPAHSVAGVVAWYSVIHVPDALLPAAFAEFRRVLVPGGYVLLGFQAGDEVTHRTEAAGHQVSLDFHRRMPDGVMALLEQAGFAPCARMLREPEPTGGFPESLAQGFVLARTPAAT